MIKLGSVADVKISGVDKKSNPGERTIRLCNYTDVYYNWAITKEMYDALMVASAKSAEIDEFTIGKGMVAITKDSETREDIGHPVYVADDFEDVLLGYHCALIKPHKGELDGRFLNAALHTSYAARYFANNSAGSGQRYYLNEDAIKRLSIYLPLFKQQTMIGQLWSNIDRKICLNRKKIEKLEALAKTIYDYWFVQFDFPDANGRPYKSSGGKMVWNEHLKCEVPAGWKVALLSSLCSISTKQCAPSKIDCNLLEHYSIPAFDEGVYPSFDPPSAILSNKFVVPNGGILYSKLNAQFKRIWDPLHLTDLPIASSEFVIYVPHDLKLRGFVYATLNDERFYKFANSISSCSTGSRKRFTPETTCRFHVAIPNGNGIVEQFSKLFSDILSSIRKCRVEGVVLRKARDFLLPLLMNGQVEVGV